MEHTLAVIGVGNMAQAVLKGMLSSNQGHFSQYILFDQNTAQYSKFEHQPNIRFAASVADAVKDAKFVLLAVKPQNYSEVLLDLSSLPNHASKLYISIAAGIEVRQVSNALSGAQVVRVLPNVPMLIGQGVSLICNNPAICPHDFEIVCDMFRSAGNIILIEEVEMNRMISVTSSSPAYVFRFIQAIADGASAQGLNGHELINAICDVVIGSAMLLKSSGESPNDLIAKVASKGGTTEKALEQLSVGNMDQILQNAMLACTERAEELGQKNK